MMTSTDGTDSATLALELGELAFKLQPNSRSIFHEGVKSIKDDSDFLLFLSPWLRLGWISADMFVVIFRHRSLSLCLTVLSKIDCDTVHVCTNLVLFPGLMPLSHVVERREKIEWMFTRWQINCCDTSLWETARQQNDREGLEAMLPFHPLFPLFLVGITTKSASAQPIPTDLLWEVFDMM